MGNVTCIAAALVVTIVASLIFLMKVFPGKRTARIPGKLFPDRWNSPWMARVDTVVCCQEPSLEEGNNYPNCREY